MITIAAEEHIFLKGFLVRLFLSKQQFFMNNFLTITFGFLFSLSSYGQGKSVDRKISLQDSILLRNFWTDFKSAITLNDKDKLAALCEFPFYCRPCINDKTLKINDHVTINVTKKLFYESQYQEFLDSPIRNEIEKHKSFETYIFYPTFDNHGKRNGFMFSYTIVAPSKKWEGLQGFIYVSKKSGKFKITGIDTVP
ncbi:hypothetical protein [Limnovirga soli]|uniref:Uncharacterized protein n=1 Tax=Limnovirga soli TaxID=2656915 RepID=A0A8J8FDN3_9BACT|nr:hypothetical protein [Limnovirga soli]NNV54743.1 hypothetical protein [Limnovirga soli]